LKKSSTTTKVSWEENRVAIAAEKGWLVKKKESKEEIREKKSPRVSRSFQPPTEPPDSTKVVVHQS